ncbi:sulfatase-like hydrolase/transferase [Qipengyuania sp. 6B39]|uniref:sulfatase-like hydrolase/transferase n=1 Tax=Qipengyuania proteolytica TaxID=2867239 RepID=UPI001C8AF1DF|nr:sulfatase-like hydrolase/transferase [Qipengyuania proteolytica]MBX7494726.1 sulfatase-like hydrolase/transferase [Qipengyuania proteolytica]
MGRIYDSRLVAGTGALIDRLGLDPAWVAYLAMLWLQAGVLFGQVAVGFGVSGRAVVLHLGLLGLLTVFQAALWTLLPVGRAGRCWGRPLLAAVVQLVLLLLYLANLGSVLTISSRFDASLVTLYLADPLPMVAAAGIHPLTAVVGLVLLATACFAANVLIVRHWARDRTRWPGPTGLSVLGMGAYLLVQPQMLAAEFLHRLEGAQPRNFAPAVMLAPSGPREVLTYPDTGPVTPRPLILITIDSVRADTMQVYGAATRNTPFLARLRAEGRLRAYDDAYALCTSSYCGLIGILASRYWSGMTGQLGNLPDALKAHGYRNLFFLSGHHRTYFQLAEHYGEQIDVYRDVWNRGDRHINEDSAMLDWLDETPIGETPREFMWFHLMGAHRLAYRNEDSDLEVLDWGASGSRRPADDALATHVRRYHIGLREADGVIEQIFARLDAAKMLDDALVVITSDHGEYLGENGLTGHGKPPTWPITAVPLLVYGGGAQDWPDRAPASSVDIAPTFLHAIGAPIPDQWAGIALQQPTRRCAVESGSTGNRVLTARIGDADVRLWEVTGKGKGEFLAPARASAPPVDPVTGPAQQQTAAQVRSCLAAR